MPFSLNFLIGSKNFIDTIKEEIQLEQEDRKRTEGESSTENSSSHPLQKKIKQTAWGPAN